MRRMEMMAPMISTLWKPKESLEVGRLLANMIAAKLIIKPARSDSKWAASLITKRKKERKKS